METYLAHHGRLGQKWGKKNGPPYPLDFNKLSDEEKREAKRKAINEGDVRTAHANRNHFNDYELNAVMKRFDINKKLSEYNRSTIKTGSDKVNDLCRKMGKMSDSAEQAIKGYNTLAKLSNAFVDTEFPIINNGGGKHNNKHNKNKNKNKHH